MLSRGPGLGKSACKCQAAISVVDPLSVATGSFRQLTALEGVIENKKAHVALAYSIIVMR